MFLGRKSPIFLRQLLRDLPPQYKVEMVFYKKRAKTPVQNTKIPEKTTNFLKCFRTLPNAIRSSPSRLSSERGNRSILNKSRIPRRSTQECSWRGREFSDLGTGS